MGNKRLAINLVANTISYGTTVLVAFFLTPYLISTIGKEAYSFYPLANNFVSYMSIITISLSSMASRFITIEIVKGNLLKANQYLVSVLYSTIFISLLLLLPMLGIIFFVNLILNVPLALVSSVRLLFSLVFLSMIINVTTSVFGVAVFVRNKLEYDSMAEITVGILRVVLYLILFTFFEPNIYYVGLVASVISIVLFAFDLFFTRKLLPDLIISKKYYDFSLVREVFSSGVWNSVNQIGAMLLASVSLLFSNIFLGAGEAGIYAIGLTIPAFINGIISMLTAVFMPTLTHTYAQGDTNQLVLEVIKSQKIMGLVTNVPIVIYMALGAEFFTLWMPSEDPYKLRNLSFLIIGHLIITGVVWPLSNLNLVLNKVKIPSLYMLFSGIVNIIFIILLLKTTSLGIYAIALASFFINIIWVGLFIPIYPTICLGISMKTFYPAVINTLVGGFILFAVTNMIKVPFPINTWGRLIMISSILGPLGILINGLLIFNFNEIKQMMSLMKVKFNQ